MCVKTLKLVYCVKHPAYSDCQAQSVCQKTVLHLTYKVSDCKICLSKHLSWLISRCDISLSISRFNLSFNKGFHNPDPPRKRTAPFGAKTTQADSTLKRLLPLYFSILILNPDWKSFCTI